jgi:hypothetical protein
MQKEWKMQIIDFRLLLQLIAGTNSVLVLLHRFVMGNVVDIFKVHAASIFRIKA